MNQDAALSYFRKDVSNGDPAPYTVRDFLGRSWVWLSVNMNTGWHHPIMRDGKMVGLQTLGYPESERDGDGLNFALKYIGPMQRKKIEELFNK